MTEETAISDIHGPAESHTTPGSEGELPAPALRPAVEAETEQPFSLWRWVWGLSIAFVGVAFLCFFTHWYEVQLFGERGPGGRQIIVHALSPFVFFLLFLILIVPNAILRAICRPLGLGRRQLLAILALWLLTGAICFANLVMPITHTAGTLNNRAYKSKTMQAARDQLKQDIFLPDEAASDYYYGKSEDVTRIPLTDVPWSLWWKPLRFWVPFMLLVIIFSVALVRTVHRQWSKHELLAYPLAEFADAMITPGENRALPVVFYDRAFWCGFIAIFFVYLLNGLHNWFPQVVDVPMGFAHYDLVKNFSFLNKYCGSEAYSLFRATLYPAVIAIAVLLPAEISLTAWLGWVLMILGTGCYFLASGEAMGRSETGYIRIGCYFAMMIMVVYIGRREYWTILRHAVTFRRTEDPALQSAVRACRVFVLAGVGLVALLMLVGFDLLLASIVVGTFGLVVLLAARMTAEMGFPWLENLGGLVHSIPLKILGISALGPKGLALLAVIGSLLATDMTNSVAAQQTTIERLAEKDADKPGRGAFRLLLMLGACVAIGCAVFFTLWENHSFGAQKEGPAARALRTELRNSVNSINRLETQGLLDDALQAGGSGQSAESRAGLFERTGLGRLRQMRLPDNFVGFFLAGAMIIVFCASMRLRFTWWPLHPLPFLFFGSWAMSRMYFSFLLGWLIKIALLRIGGGRVFSRMKPFFIGVIVGQVVIAGIWVLVNAIYYWYTGDVEPTTAVKGFV